MTSPIFVVDISDPPESKLFILITKNIHFFTTQCTLQFNTSVVPYSDAMCQQVVYMVVRQTCGSLYPDVALGCNLWGVVNDAFLKHVKYIQKFNFKDLNLQFAMTTV